MAVSRLRVGGGKSETDSDSHPRPGRNSRWNPRHWVPWGMWGVTKSQHTRISGKNKAKSKFPWDDLEKQELDPNPGVWHAVGLRNELGTPGEGVIEGNASGQLDGRTLLLNVSRQWRTEVRDAWVRLRGRTEERGGGLNRETAEVAFWAHENKGPSLRPASPSEAGRHARGWTRPTAAEMVWPPHIGALSHLGFFQLIPLKHSFPSQNSSFPTLCSSMHLLSSIVILRMMMSGFPPSPHSFILNLRSSEPFLTACGRGPFSDTSFSVATAVRYPGTKTIFLTEFTVLTDWPIVFVCLYVYKMTIKPLKT